MLLSQPLNWLEQALFTNIGTDQDKTGTLKERTGKLNKVIYKQS